MAPVTPAKKYWVCSFQSDRDSESNTGLSWILSADRRKPIKHNANCPKEERRRKPKKAETESRRHEKARNQRKISCISCPADSQCLDAVVIEDPT